MADLDPGSGAVTTVLRMGLFGPASFNIGGRELRFKSLKLRAALGYIALSESQTEWGVITPWTRPPSVNNPSAS